jgi:SET domain-containing protein
MPASKSSASKSGRGTSRAAKRPKMVAPNPGDLPYEVRKSRLHGYGLFAARKIGKGELIGWYRGVRTRKDGMHVLWVEEDDEKFGLDGVNELRDLNHSKRPNAAFWGDELYAVKAIAKGGEITFNYDGHEWDEDPSE